MSLIERAVARLGNTSDDTTLRPVSERVEPSIARTIFNPTLHSGGFPAELPDTPALADLGRGTREPHPAQEPLILDLDSLATRGFAVPGLIGDRASHDFRLVKRPLVANATGRSAAPVKNARRVMVTSSLPGEGKTFCAINLALSIASERDLKVLLVDADVARPTLLGNLGVAARPGLIELLEDASLRTEDYVLPTNVDRLSILPAGRKAANATELLASERMGRLLDDLTQRYSDRIIVFDSPPVLVTTEARVLSHWMGQVVFIVAAGETPKEAVREALSTLDSCEVIGTVLNKARASAAGSYGSYYGYGYGNQERI